MIMRKSKSLKNRNPTSCEDTFAPFKTFSQAEWRGIQMMKEHRKKEKKEKEEILRKHGVFI